MRMFIFLAALILAGSAYAAPDCSNFGGDNLAGCGAEDFAVDRAQDYDEREARKGSLDFLEE